MNTQIFLKRENFGKTNDSNITVFHFDKFTFPGNKNNTTQSSNLLYHIKIQQ